MNGLEAILATCALLLGFGILLAAVNEQNDGITNAVEGIAAKTTALDCASIIDSITSNSANQYLEKFKCKLEKNTAKTTIGSQTKQAQTIVETEQNFGIQILGPKHYLKENN